MGVALVAPRLDSCGSRLSNSKSCRIVPDQKSNSCLLHWQVDSLPLCHQRSPLLIFLIVLVRKVKVSQACPTLCDPIDYTVHGILQANILEWIAFPFSRGSSQPRDRTQVSHIAGRFFTSWATRELFSIKIIPMKCRVLIAILKGIIILLFLNLTSMLNKNS